MPQRKGITQKTLTAPYRSSQPERVVAGFGVPGDQSVFTGSVPRESHLSFVWFFVAQFVGFGSKGHTHCEKTIVPREQGLIACEQRLAAVSPVPDRKKQLLATIPPSHQDAWRAKGSSSHLGKTGPRNANAQ
jgi:hypothetical protein